MIITTYKLPDISEYVQHISLVQIASDISVVVILKQLYRDDDILVDIYLNEISDDTKIIAGRKLTKDALICQPRYDLGFNYYVHCIDQDGTNQAIKKYNVNKFYLQFTNYDGEEWKVE